MMPNPIARLLMGLSLLGKACTNRPAHAPGPAAPAAGGDGADFPPPIRITESL